MDDYKCEFAARFAEELDRLEEKNKGNPRIIRLIRLYRAKNDKVLRQCGLK